MMPDDPDILAFGDKPRHASRAVRRARIAALAMTGVAGIAVAGLAISSSSAAQPHRHPPTRPAAVSGQYAAFRTEPATAGFLRAELPAVRVTFAPHTHCHH
jgi:hypothetical protein